MLLRDSVALRKESVDRNFARPTRGTQGRVALRKESVDRNFGQCFAHYITNNVALRKESVDRNKRLGLLGWLRTLSLSARRAWIEILQYDIEKC